MAITATSSTGATRKIAPQGNHVARCYSMIDLGTQTTEYNGETKKARKVRITWELPNETEVFNEEVGPQPFVVSKEYSLSMHEKSTLRKDLESWRGKGFTEEEAKAFDISKLLGVPCMINVVHGVSKTSGKAYVDVSAITPLPKGFTCPPQVNKSVEFSLQTPDMSIYESLPEWLKDKIKASPEFEHIALEYYNEEAIANEVAQESSDLPF